MTPTSPASNPVTMQPAPSSPPSWLRPFLVGVVLIFILGLGINTVFRAGPYTIGGKRWGSPAHRTDLTVYTEAGRAVLHGTDIYQAHNVRGWYYIYPPLFAIFFVPFALLSTFWAAIAWYTLSVLLIAWALKMSVELVSDALHFDGDPLWLYALPPVLVLLPLVSGLARGQASPVLLWFITAGLFYGWKRQDWRGGICFAGGILLKVFPVILLAYFVWRKRWRFVLATMTATVIGAFIIPAAVYGWQRNIDYLREWMDVIGKPALETESERTDNPLYAQLLSSQLPRNQSLPAVMTRITGRPQGRWVGIGIGVVMAAVMLVVGWRAGARREIYIISAAVVWMLLVPPVSWSHYFPLLFLPLAALIAVAMTREAGSGRQAARAALVVFAILSLTLAGSRKAQVYGPLCWGTLALWAALMVCARHGSAPSIRREKV
jgi:alpha-1,2-mannosyltransferase